VVEEAGRQLTRTEPGTAPTAASLEGAIARFRAEHAAEPTGAALRYHEALARFVGELAPDASPALRLAAWCQHLGRHALPRSAYPAGLAGYKRWRAAAALEHARQARAILDEAGVDPTVGARVGELLVKKGLRSDPEVQTLEDAVCLTFLEVDLAAFAAKHPDDKLIDILRKTWAKMSPRGHARALELAQGLPPALADVVARAVS